MNPPTAHSDQARIALYQAAVLIALCLIIFAPEFVPIYNQVVSNAEAAVFLAMPVMLGLLLYQRWGAIRQGVSGGSVWGFVLILLALTLMTVATWPFNYGYPRLIALVMALGGVVLATCGWRVLGIIAPMLLLILVCLPVGPRIYARLIIGPETITLEVAQMILDALPGVFVDLNGLDPYYIDNRGAGTIALGEPHKGASLFAAYIAIGIFVTFVRFRPVWQVVIMAAAAVAVAAFCNLVRVLLYGLVTIYANQSPTDALPRGVSIIGSLLLAYGMYVILLEVLNRMIVEVPRGSRSDPDNVERSHVTHATAQA